MCSNCIYINTFIVFIFVGIFLFLFLFFATVTGNTNLAVYFKKMLKEILLS